MRVMMEDHKLENNLIPIPVMNLFMKIKYKYFINFHMIVVGGRLQFFISPSYISLNIASHVLHISSTGHRNRNK